MATIPLNNWVSRAGVRLHLRAWARPTATTTSAAVVAKPIRVRATPLLTWYDRPEIVSAQTIMVATSTPSDSVACTAAAPIKVAGRSRILASSRHSYPRRVPAFLIVNPHATTTTARCRDVIVRALASFVKLEVVHTRYRGHAAELAMQAAADGHEMLFTLGGDGTINEVVNGLFRGRGAHDARGDGAWPDRSATAAAAAHTGPGRSTGGLDVAGPDLGGSASAVRGSGTEAGAGGRGQGGRGQGGADGSRGTGGAGVGGSGVGTSGAVTGGSGTEGSD